MKVADTCNYCGEREAVADASYMCRMYREAKWKIEKTKIAVPRCMQCKSIHRQYRIQSLFIGCSISTVAFSYPIISELNDSIMMSLVLIWISCVIGCILGEILNKWYFNLRVIPRKFGIKFQENVHQAECIKSMQRKNWILRDPRPND